MKKTWKRATVVLLGLMLVFTTFLPFLTAKADTDMNRFNVEVKVGFDNKAEMGHYVPFAISVENPGNDFSGRIQLVIPNKVNYNIMYESEFSIGRGETKTVLFYGKVVDNYGKMRVRITDKKGKLVWTREDRLNVDVSASKRMDIGILSDDYSALGYLDNIEFYSSETFKTNLMELTVDTFPESVNGLDMLEVILISNFSTDQLTDEQVEALNMWINRGGILIVGTGSNSSKTLSKLKGNVVDVTSSKMTKYSTSFGIGYYYYQYQPDSGNYPDYDSNPRDDEDFMSFYDDLFYNHREELDEYCLEDFMAEFGLTENDLENGTVPYDLEDVYYDYCIDVIYLYAYGYQPEPQPVYTYPMVSADVLALESDEAFDYYYGDSTSGDYILASMIERGKGIIALYGIDFTMNPIPSYANASEILYPLLQRFALPVVEENYKNSQNTWMNYNFANISNSSALRTLLGKASGAPLPPALFYAVPIIGYLVAMLVLYLVNRKKKKTFRLWIWYPVLALAVAVFIFCVGFSTRIIKPRINAMTVLELQKPAAIENNYVAVTTPSNRTCEVSFSKQYNLELIREIESYYSSNTKVDSNSYRVAFREGIDNETVRFAGNVALSSDQFLLESIYPSERTFNVDVRKSYFANDSNAEKCIIHNDTGVDLENVFVVAVKAPYSGQNTYYDTVVFRIGDLKSGGSFDMSSQKWRSSDNNMGYSADVAFTVKDKHTLEGVLFGSLSEKFTRYQNRASLASYLYGIARDSLKDDINQSPVGYQGTAPISTDDDVLYEMYIIGFPKNSVCKDIQFTNKYRNERTEAVIQKIKLSQMKETN
ncbi:MAG: hypothetical protein IKP92_01610 [Lachnospiraceae bacterium]|nr:hypothetical protein [Lachnospiraceae bacterium]